MPEAIKDFLKKIGIYIVVAIIGIAFGVSLFKKKVKEYENIVQKLQESHKKELDEIQKAREEERKKYEENERKYKERMEAIEKEYNETKKIFEERKASEVKKIVKVYGGKPDQLAEKFSKATGFRVVLPED
jgi:flagellar motility protein MotE (MotC chaperone)